MNKEVKITLTGKPGSGKTILAKRIKELIERHTEFEIVSTTHEPETLKVKVLQK